ncbi:hypothetical protein Pint_09011 [Pistacia integerrima]|uniref:Uncharacterized protein n=1 Tax=Pistacia integerrima TaxID=434235 RepID=A0ACC0XSQ3_9ROSI|nr:hypothetical protein Pint_09011 [Pistacia integerrima]
MALCSIFFLCVLLTVLPHPSQSITANQSQFFVLMKTSLSGDALSGWDTDGGKHYCNFSGISCNNQGYVDKIDISGWSLSGQFPSGVCSYLPQLRILRLDHNHLYGNFSDSFVNCSFLGELKMSYVYLQGILPDFSPMKSLRILDLSYNLFTGDFPISVTNLSNLEVLNFNENPAGNYLTGQIPPEIGLLKNLQQLELFNNQHLSGTIPEELGNLTELTYLDMSVNHLRGKIPESICRLPKLRVLGLYNNSLTGEIPSAIGNSTTLTILSLYDNFLTGEAPQNLGQFSSMVVLDLSENRLSGPLPTDVCNGGKLKYFLVLSNLFSGELPASLEKCTSLLRFQVSNNRLEGPIPQALIEKNKVGQGGSGTVYKIELKSGETVAVKKLGSQRTNDSASEDQLLFDRILKTENSHIHLKQRPRLMCTVSGVVLMELITGRKPVEADFGENKNIIYWVSTKIDSKDRAMEVFDKRLSGSFREEMIQVLRIAIRCTSKAPAVRPTMNEVVQLLAEADPCKFGTCQFSED